MTAALALLALLLGGCSATADQWMPHGHCFFWSPAVLAPSVIGNALVATAYASIPLWLVYTRRRWPGIIPAWFAGSFAVFIVLCGAGHAIKLVTIWSPIYAFEAWWDAATGVVSVAVSVALWRLVPTLPPPTISKKQVESGTPAA